MQQPVTTDPITIMLINMTIVFAVLYGLSWIIRLIQYVDPTRKKEEPVKPAPVLQETQPSAVVATPPTAKTPIPPDAGAPALSSSVVADTSVAAVTEDATVGDEFEITAVIAAALAAYGYSFGQFVAVRHAGEQSWTKIARIEGINTRNQMG